MGALELDAIGNGGLHPIEEEEAAKEHHGDGGGGNEKKEAGSLAASGDGPAEAVNDARHGVEAVKPAPAQRNERRGIGDWRREHPELDEEGDHVADISIESVKRRHPEADAQSGEDREEKQHGKPECGERGFDAVNGGDNKENNETN